MNQENLTIRNCESYLYDGKIYKNNLGRSLVELFASSPELIPKDTHQHLALYKIEKECLVYVGISPVGFSDNIEKLDVGVEDCFVLVLEKKKKEKTYHLISFKADFLSWEEAIIIRKDIDTGESKIDFVSEDSNFMTHTYFKRFFTNFPFFLLENGVKAAYPILATKENTYKE